MNFAKKKSNMLPLLKSFSYPVRILLDTRYVEGVHAGGVDVEYEH